MKLEVVHKYDFPVDEVERVLFDERLLPLLKERMTTLLDVKPLNCRRDGNTLHREVKYFPKPMISSVAGKKVEPEWMVFTEVSTYDLASHKGTFKNLPQHHRIAPLLTNQGELLLRATGPASCEQVIRTEVKVDVFVVGKIAEKIIASNGEKLLEEQAAVLRGVLERNELPK